MMNLTNEVYEDLKCPICFEVPESKIFMCQNGHNICDNCSVDLLQCPQCRESMEEDVKARNRTLEMLMDKMKFACAFKDNGCLEEFGRREVQEHNVNCKYRYQSGKLVNFCQLIGYHDCEFPTNLYNLPPALEHYRKAHGFVFRKDKNFSMYMKNFEEIALLTTKGSATTLLSTVVVEVANFSFKNTNTFLAARNSADNSHGVNSPTLQDDTNEAKFALFCLVHGKDKNTSWTCISLAPEPAQFRVEFCIKSLSREAPDLTWTTPTVDISHVAAVLPNPPIRIPLDVLEQYYLTKADKSLVMNVKITPANNKKDDGDCTLSGPLTQLSFDRILDQNLSTTTSTSTSPPASPPPIFEGTKCDECGKCPLTEVIYRLPSGHRQESVKYNFCKDCALSDANMHPWFFVIKKLEECDTIDDHWMRKLRQWCTSEYPLGYNVKCVFSGCRRQALYTCLQCNEAAHSRLCEDCMDKISKNCNHVFAMCKR